MIRMTVRAAAAAAGALILAACEDAARPLGPSRPRALLDVQSGGGTMIAFVETTYHCTAQPGDWCGGEETYWFRWTWASSIATVSADGSGQVSVTPGQLGSADADPAWSPDGMRLVFQRRGEILGVAGGGGIPINLTNHSAFDHAPAWSPDGARIAFASDRGGQKELYVMDAAGGSNVARLTNGVGFVGRPDWSADGSRIAFDCVIENGNLDVCAVNADGTGFVRLTSDPASDFAADWSPAGQIAFATARYGLSEIAVMNGDGSGVRRVAAGVGGADPDWSPDGARILFADGSNVYVMQADGAGIALITNSASSAPAEGFRYESPQPVWRPVDTPLPPLEPPVARLGTPSCNLLTCTFDGSGSTADGGIASLSWSFGDGSGNYTSLSPTHTYAGSSRFVVTLTITNGVGKTSQATQMVAVDGGTPPPPPKISASCTYLDCRFSTDGSVFEREMYARTWTFGDGGTGTGANPSRMYSVAGTYAVSATATDYKGRSATSWLSVTVVPPLSQLPVASFTTSCVRTKCTFDGRASSDDQGIVSYAWKLGNQQGSIAVGAVVTIDYKRAGSYTVTLTVQDAVGNWNSLTRTIAVTK